MSPVCRHLARLLALAGLAVLVPACGSNSKDHSGLSPSPGPGPGPSPSPSTVFSEDFGGAFPGTSWTLTSGGTGAATTSGAAGNPSPSLQMTGMTMGDFVRAKAMTQAPAGAVTISVDIAVPAAGEGSGGMDVLDGTDTPVAVVEWHPTAAGGAITFMIHPTGSPTPQFFAVPPPTPGAGFHHFELMVDAAHLASWKMDGAGAVMSLPDFPAGPYSLRIYDQILGPTSPTAVFQFDNVKISSP